MRQQIFTAALVCGLTGCAIVRGGDEDSIQLSSTPPAVQTAVTKLVGTNKIEELKKETEGGKTVFEVEFEVNDVDHSATISETGEVIEEEAEVEVKDLPPAVVAAVTTAHAGAKLDEASSVKAGGKSFFEVDAMVGGDKHEIQIDAGGKILSDKVEKDEKGEHKD